MSDHEKDLNGVETIESPTNTLNSRTTKRSRAKNHCARWWWVHLIVVIVVGLAITLGLIFGAIPKIGQKTINDSTLEVNAISIQDPTDTTFTFGINSTIHGSVPVKSHLNPQQLEMFIRYSNGTQGRTFMVLNVSKLDLHNTIPLDISNYPMKIVDQDAFTEFTGVVLGSESLNMGVYSRPDLYVGAIHNTVTYNKTVKLAGFNKLTGLSLSNPRLVVPAAADGTNLLTDCTIPNPSAFTIDMGNLTMNFMTGGLALGFGVVQNLVLRPGDNHVHVRATIPSTFAEAPSLLNATLAAPSTKITLLGNSTINDGVHITWLEAALNSLSIDVASPGSLGPSVSE